MSTNSLSQKKPTVFTRTLLGACCFFALQANAHAAHDKIFVTKHGDAIFRVADKAGVTLTLSSGENAGEIVYTLENPDATTTTSLLTGVSRNVVVHTKSGMDNLTFSNLEVPKTLNIYTGSGADNIDFFGVTVGKNLNVNTGNGDDTITGGFVGVHGSTRLITGKGNDSIEIGGVTTKSRLYVASGAGNDFVDLQEMVTGGRTLINTGHGDDDVALTDIENTNRFRLFTGKGNDNVELAALDFSSRSEFRMGAGDDRLELSESTFSHVKPLFVGGAGKDTFGDEQNNAFIKVKPRIIRFEEIIDISNPEPPIDTTYALGDIGPGGGIVFQVDEDGTTGLEIMPIDLTNGTGIVYGCSGINVADVIDGDSDLQTGSDKTAALIAADCSAEAAILATNYVSANGIGDWFLPSAPELNLAIAEAILQGTPLPNPGFPYWSSSESTNNNAFQVFNTTPVLDPSPEDKSLIVTDDGSTTGVSPVRQFTPTPLAN